MNQLGPVDTKTLCVQYIACFYPSKVEFSFLGAQFLAQYCISAGFAGVLSVAQVLSVPAGNTEAFRAHGLSEAFR